MAQGQRGAYPACMALVAAPHAAAPDPVRVWSWHAVKAMALLCVVALGVQLGQLPSSASEPAPPAAVKAEAAPPPAAPPAPEPPRYLTLDRQLEYGDYAWTEEGAPAGPVTIEIDLAGEILSVMRGNVEIGRAAILFGTDDKPTPTGSFRITQKKRHHVSNLYNAPMPYMMRLTDDGIAIHGSIVEYGSATRGCIGVPDEFAALLFDEARIGTRVVIVDGTA